MTNNSKQCVYVCGIGDSDVDADLDDLAVFAKKEDAISYARTTFTKYCDEDLVYEDPVQDLELWLYTETLLGGYSYAYVRKCELK